MKYEKKNNIGVLLMMGGSVLIVVSLFVLSDFLLAVGIIGSVAMVAVGGYMMTRGFTDLDQDHPDYNRYQQLKEESRTERENK